MAINQQALTENDCEELFEADAVPIDRLVQLDNANLLTFVGYVLKRAGYQIEHVADGPVRRDLILHSPTKRRVAYVQVAAWGDERVSVGVDAVRNIQRKLGLEAFKYIPAGYLITASSEFTQLAQQEALQMPRLQLINGVLLARFIRYVRGSRHIHSSNSVLPIERLLEADRVRPNLRQPTETKVLTLSNNKGGVGKTTTALNIAFNLARRQNRVLLIDLDAQANLTYSLPYMQLQSPNAFTLADYFLRHHQAQTNPLPQLVRQTEFPLVSLIPSHPDLRMVDMNVADWSTMEIAFARDVHDPEVVALSSDGSSKFDWIIIDTPPAMSLYTRSALATAHFVLAPVVPSTYASLGLTQLFNTANAMQALMGTGVHMLGCAITSWDGRQLMTSAAARLEAELQNKRIRLFSTKIPYDQKIEEAHRETAAGRRRSLFELARRPSPAAQKYHELVDELLEYV